MNRKRLQQGLTFLEVLVALAIFAIAGSAILKAVGENSGAVSQLESITIANWVANNQLTQLKIKDSWPIKNNQKGSVDMAERSWYWKQTVTATNDKDLKAVSIEVGLDESYNEVVTTVTAYFAKPASST